MSERSRPLRNLAAWGYESSSTDTRVEIDVWTVNAGERDEAACFEQARRAFAATITVEQCFGNVARVRYDNLGTEGYRYIAEDEPAPQQAYAGAKRSAGGARTTAGTFGSGYSSPVGTPGVPECVDHGNTEVIPEVQKELREIGRSITREPPSDENDEEVAAEPFEGFRNVIRLMPGSGKETYRYRVGPNDKGGAGDADRGSDVQNVGRQNGPLGRQA